MFDWKFTVGLYDRSDRAIRCDVLERHVRSPELRDSVNIQQDVYLVRVYKSENTTFLLGDVPRRAIQFFDEKYTSDLFLGDAFRHEIGLPDALVPEMWRDMDEEQFVALYSWGLRETDSSEY